MYSDHYIQHRSYYLILYKQKIVFTIYTRNSSSYMQDILDYMNHIV